MVFNTTSNNISVISLDRIRQIHIKLIIIRSNEKKTSFILQQVYNITKVTLC